MEMLGTNFNLENNVDLRINLHSTRHSELFVRYRAINTLNDLSGDLRSSSSITLYFQE